MKNLSSLLAGFFVACSFLLAQGSAVPQAWHLGISKTGINVRGAAVNVGQIDMTASDSGSVVVTFDGTCYATVGDRIILAASDAVTWGVNDGNTSIMVSSSSKNYKPFSHTRVYRVGAGSHSFYAVAQNYVDEGGSGMASIYASLTVTYYPVGTDAPFAAHAGISKTNIDLRTALATVGQVAINAPLAGKAIVRFDGVCISSAGDRIILAASDAQNWGVNDGNVGVEAASTTLNRNSFCHSRTYNVSAGAHTFYAVAENYVEEAGSGMASIYGSLTVEYLPTAANKAFVTNQELSLTSKNVRGSPVALDTIIINPTVSGKAIVRFNGSCISSSGDRIILAASNAADWGVNDGNVGVEAYDSDINANSFSHTRVYDVAASVPDTFFAVAQNYVDMAGDGTASIYASLTLEFIPNAVLNSVTNIVILPASPAAIAFGDNVNITFDYSTGEAGGARIFCRPFTNNALTPNYAAHGSPLYPVGNGSGSGNFTITSGNVEVDSVRIQMWNAAQTVLLFETFVPVRYLFGPVPNQVTNIVILPASPASLAFSDNVNITFDYSTGEAGGARIFCRPFTNNALTPNYAAHGSPLYPAGLGSGSGNFTITSGNVEVDSIRIQMWNAAQTALLFETYVPVRYTFGPTTGGVSQNVQMPPKEYRVTMSLNGTIRFSMPAAGPAKVRVYDCDGRYLTTLLNGAMPSGIHQVQWTAGNGVYLARIDLNGRSLNSRMIIVR